MPCVFSPRGVFPFVEGNSIHHEDMKGRKGGEGVSEEGAEGPHSSAPKRFPAGMAGWAPRTVACEP